MSIPNFMIVGAQKSGTDSLYGYLKEHPAVVMAAPKEPDYFSRDPRYVEWGWYASCFVMAENAKAVGEASTSYMAIPATAQRIAETLGNRVKLIFILRNPVERIYSSYLHMRKSRPFYDKRPIDQAICWQKAELGVAVQEEQKRLAVAAAAGTIDLASFSDFGAEAEWNYRYIANSWYRAQIEIFLQYFPKETLFFLLFDELKQNWRETARRLFEFVGVDPDFANQLQVSQRHKTRMPAEGALGTILAYRPFRNLGRQLAKVNAGAKIKKFIKNRATRNYEPMPVELRKQLTKMFTNENKQLSKLIGIDLSHWNN